MKQQITDTVVMISPDTFGYNVETSVTNVFQHTALSLGLTNTIVQKKALSEFSSMKNTLMNAGVRVLELSSPKESCPDAVFPNNWFSHHENGTLVVYPMLAPNRRKERQTENLQNLLIKAGIPVTNIIDLTKWEKKQWFLEGTGSIALDRTHNVAFAMESARTSREAFFSWCSSFSYVPILFHGYDTHHTPVYHTNILINIGNTIAVVSDEAISDMHERNRVLHALKTCGKEILSISTQQMISFCGNILQLKTKDGKTCIVLSTTAFDAFRPDQRRILEKHGRLIPVDIPTIETIGGGGSRCMLAEVFH